MASATYQGPVGLFPAPTTIRGDTRGGAPAGVPPVPPAAVDLLARSDAELVAAQLSTSPGERFVHAHLAALRAGAALLQVTGRPQRRPSPRTVWEMVSLVAPALAPWTAYFADGARLRSAIEAGRDEVVDAERAEQLVCVAEDFQDAVRALLDDPARGQMAARGVRAS
ncbi:SAV_6107 family HEPN domain-containing protein [Actinotalea sp. K2]|uniref:SAV_6107 family HEPN domain-containing protein n=1 Tax=Actinotalea sp. K2 TaxID=2939438 RepID=UPI002017D0CE|nr:SAV_6107 family HEPN domain-containing protein [Actinotalea sp. K2]MCL3860136.1 SAV_6107 family HEPN domain-containing protein [Actinotalea sp. K2]